MSLFSISSSKLIWVIGAAERLATLGMIDIDIPCQLHQDKIDEYIRIDNRRFNLFKNDYEIAAIFYEVIRENGWNVDESEGIEEVIDLLISYKNNRTEMVKYALCNSKIFS